MFRRTKQEASTSVESADSAVKEGGKGRPTPSRKEAEAARKERLRTPRTRKEAAAQNRLSRSESSQRMRQAMKSGDDRYLPERDKGPVKRFVRDFVDVRFSLMEIVVPLMIVTLVLGVSGNTTLIAFGNALLYTGLLLIIVDLVRMRFGLRKQLAQRFPGQDTRRTYGYAVMRSLQMKWMRMPKAQVKIGQTLPQDYR